MFVAVCRLAPELIMIAKDGSISLRTCARAGGAVEPVSAGARPGERFSLPESMASDAETGGQHEGTAADAKARSVDTLSPPEVAAGESATAETAATAAAWALGIVLFFLLAGYPPFANGRLEDCRRRPHPADREHKLACRSVQCMFSASHALGCSHVHARRSYFKAFAESNQIHFPHFFSTQAVDLLCGLLSRSPSLRFTFEQVRWI